MDSSQNTVLGSGGNGMLATPLNDTEAAVDDPKQNLNEVIDSIQKTLGQLHQLYLTVSSFNTASQLPLLQRLNGLVTELDNMVKLSERCNIQVPMEVLNLIDDGKNPDEFTRGVMNSCITKNQVTKGKTDAFKSLRKHLLEELEQTFPDEVESYREIRAMSAAEAKRLAQSQSSLPNGDVKHSNDHDKSSHHCELHPDLSRKQLDWKLCQSDDVIESTASSGRGRSFFGGKTS